MQKKARLLSYWTVFYALAAALFFHILFDFDIWLGKEWFVLTRSRIYGFSGFAFGISLLAAIPIYIATARHLWKTGKWPIGRPELMKPKKPDKKSEDIVKPAPEPEQVFPDTLPDELKEPYIRFNSGMSAGNASDFLLGDILAKEEPAPEVEIISDSIMPLPESFDAEPEKEDLPVFKDFDFNDKEDPSPLLFDEENGETTATYIFDDPDFWVADDTQDWFANGKQIISPIQLLLDSDAKNKILVLKTRNIMHIDDLIPEWENKGITVVSEQD